MKHHLAQLRREAVIYLAERHPDIRFADIGIAIGYAPTAANSITSAILQHAGVAHGRSRGAGAPSFDRNVLRNKMLDAHKDEVRLMVKNGVSYPTIAKKFGVDPSTVRDYAFSTWDTRRGKGSMRRATNDQILATIKANPGLSISKTGKLLGYAPNSQAFHRRYRLLIPKSGVTQ